jgi:hypothetical protein
MQSFEAQFQRATPAAVHSGFVVSCLLCVLFLAALSVLVLLAMVFNQRRSVVTLAGQCIYSL